MPDYEIRIRLTGTSPDYAQHVAWAVGKALDTYPHLAITLEPPRRIDADAAEPHAYLSTSCLHGRHEYCRATRGRSEVSGELETWAKKPAVCKFCKSACICSCHQVTGGG